MLVYGLANDKDELKHNNSQAEKNLLRNVFSSGTPIGLLAYVDNEAMAWCSIAPRETYQRLRGDESLKDVWSIAGFLSKRNTEIKGLYAFLLKRQRIRF